MYLQESCLTIYRGACADVGHCIVVSPCDLYPSSIYAIVPTKAITMGMASIMKAKKIVLLASGANKNTVVRALLDDKITTNVP
ncbi:MAG: 6-phosphogluconolactonase, partial [Alistipes sp.]|nr:6-phosphogluconolactonase [Alistipes sp.]